MKILLIFCVTGVSGISLNIAALLPATAFVLQSLLTRVFGQFEKRTTLQ